jgi:uncharacterized protein YkwD
VATPRQRLPCAALLLGVACAPGRRASPPPFAERPPAVRFLEAPPPHDDGAWLVAGLPGARWDAQLARAVEALMLSTSQRTPSLDPRVTSLATARAGFPGQARFARVLNGGARPEDLLHQIASAAGADLVDVALSKRTWGDGTTLWLVGWAPHRADLDPLPRDLPLDGTLAVRVELPRGADAARLFVASPAGPVEELALTSGVPRWVDRFHEPGTYRLEVVAERGKQTEVVLLFSVFVDTEPPVVRPPPAVELPPADPVAAERWLYAELDALRQAHGLRPVTRFPLFEPLAREHSALMAASGVVAHRIPGRTDGVPAKAARVAHPGARHHEDVAAASTADAALALVADSPGHLRNLLCEPCTHASIGVALEPVLDRPPRLFVTWELLEFPQAPPQEIHHNNK